MPALLPPQLEKTTQSAKVTFRTGVDEALAHMASSTVMTKQYDTAASASQQTRG